MKNEFAIRQMGRKERNIMLYREQNAQRALSPTSITIADYVINPFVGCDFNCVYCYARLNSTYLKKKEKLGEDFVESKPNFLALLEKEISEKRPRHVLLGSTTEVYQHIEERTTVTRSILDILNKNNTSYTILTKSHRIVRDLDLIGASPDNEVYFTVNTLDDAVRQALEPAASSIHERKVAISALHANKIRVIVHAGPYIPGITDPRALVYEFAAMCPLIEFESLNLKMADRTTLLEKLKEHYPHAYNEVQLLYKSKEAYGDTYRIAEQQVTDIAAKRGIESRFFIYPYDSYYTNQIQY
ncbi:MAG: radical SAM protein [Candidatus Omnitrophica bacterium]|nr:radical SAM protein [Candidatus Omnitrophota bacterium]